MTEYNAWLLLNGIVLFLTVYVVYFPAYQMLKKLKDSDGKYIPQCFFFHAGFHALLVLVVTPFFIRGVIDYIYYIFC
jgi:hypothetical protein